MGTIGGCRVSDVVELDVGEGGGDCVFVVGMVLLGMFRGSSTS